MPEPSGRDERQAVSDAIDEVNRAESRLDRRQATDAAPTAVERAAVRYVFERATAASPVTQQELAEHLGIAASSVTSLVKRLRDAELIESVPHPTDGRKKLLLPADGADGDDPLPARIRELVRLRSSADARTINRFLEDLRDEIDRASPPTNQTR